MIRGFLVIILLVFCLSANAQLRDSFELKNSFIPIAFFLPETSVGLGAAGIFNFKRKSAPEEQRASQILYSVAYTFRNQFLLFLPYEIYSHQQKYRYKGEIGFYKYFYNYFGVGPNILQDSFEVYDVVFPRLEFSATRFVGKNYGIGLGYRGDLFDIRRIEQDGLLANQQPVGWEGGTKSNLVALLLFDNRDHINAATKGFYAEAVFQKSVKFLGSDFDYQKWEIDLRYFKELKKNWVLANQLWVTLATEGIPFFDMAHLSTGTRARGLNDRRYINFDVYSLQSELRFPIKGRFKGAAFYSLNHIPVKRDNFKSAKQVWTYGVGLRFVIDPELRNSIRLDVAAGEGDLNFYITVNEAF